MLALNSVHSIQTNSGVQLSAVILNRQNTGLSRQLFLFPL